MKHSPRKSLESVSNFIEKTYKILQNEDFITIVGWTTLGNSFIIKDIKQFQEFILPIHFKHSNFSSFVRQLNMYNFHKVRGDRHDCEFQHEFFKKGRRDLLCKIKRKQSEALIISHNTIDEGVNNCLSVSQSSNQFKKIQEIAQIEGNSQQNLQTDNLKVQELRRINRDLKELKNQKIQKQKKLSLTNTIETGEKFFKLITSLMAQKIRKQKGIPFFQECASNQTQTSQSFDKLIDHIIGDSHPLKFNSYTQTAYKLSQKHNSFQLVLNTKNEE